MTTRTLLIGGTRNLGPAIVAELRDAGHALTVLTRGRTPDVLPADVERLHADRGAAAQLAAALAGRDFDAVVDTTLYTGAEARAAAALLDGRVGHYLWISTGQVYLVREGLARPFREEDYAGPVMAEPPREGPDWDDWTYGAEKRAAEDVFAEAWAARGFPATSLRLPMVNSERDHYDRLLNYLVRLDDGGPIVAPDQPRFALRHVYGGDVARAIRSLLARGLGRGDAINLSQDETLSLEDFLARLGVAAERPVALVRAPRARMDAAGLLPAASPFSGRWMSELDNRRSREVYGLAYTPLRDYLARLVAWHRAHPRVPAGYARRAAELALAREVDAER
ncbi:MAG TPA: NAD-dependent epimerase/dehydratase family protein [Gemmatimonadales bacterium]|nr:NAD-dependent epimerase/dehydratase family protein [Gemmatimonadales bacterium]